MNLIDLGGIKDDASDVDGFIDGLCQSLDLDFASYATANPITGDVQGYANYPDEWKMHYGQQQMHRVDPTLYMSARSIAPVDWSRFQSNAHFSTVFKDAGDFGITDRGLTVPIRGPYGDCGLLSVTRDCSDVEWNSLKKKIMGDLQMAAVHIHDTVAKSGSLLKSLDTPSLSRREIEILQWSAFGKSQQDIGDILSISHRTVEVHLRSAREKLNALTTVQAAGRGIALGLIQPG